MTVFVSYARADRDTASELACDIEQTNRTVWLDPELTGGQFWWDDVLSRIRACQLFVFVLSDKSLRSLSCITQYHYAVALNRPVLS